MRTEKTACILCSRNCGLLVDIEDGKFTKIRGDKDHPLSQGYICQKAARLDYYQNNEDRIEHPLKKQADGSFARVSWDEALDDIARRLLSIRKQYGGEAFATAGGGGQGNHLGGAYLGQMRAAMKSYYNYNSLGQEKTGDFWVNGRLFGSQECHTAEDIEHSDFIIFLGCNPYQSHGIPNARDTLKEIRKDPRRTMVVIDPRRTETAKAADIHLQLKPGTDVYLLSAMLAIIVRENLHDEAFLKAHCTGFDAVKTMLMNVPIKEYIAAADVPMEDALKVARGFAQAESACVRADLGIQHSNHSTLNSYFEKLFFLITGQFGKKGGNNLHDSLIPILSHTDERNPKFKRTVYHNMFAVSGILPPNILPDEILKAGERRIRAMIVDSCNPALTWPDATAHKQAFESLELLVVIDVAMTETARLADYVLPAASQFEKWEFTGFNMEFPKNGFQVRHPLFPAKGETLIEAEIYTRLLEKMGELPKSFPVLSRIAKYEPDFSSHAGFIAALAATFAANKKLIRYGASILYRTLGPTLENNAAAITLLLPLSISLAQKYPDAVRRAGHDGNKLTQGVNLFNAILKARSGLIFSEHRYDDVWRLVKNPQRKITLAIPELLDAMDKLSIDDLTSEQYPFILSAGERRSYNANQIYRDPKWRKIDPNGFMRMHPADAERLDLAKGDRVKCQSETGTIEAVIEIDDSVRTGYLMMPHGYGSDYQNGKVNGPVINLITGLDHCDPIHRTPLHKTIPVNIEKLSA
ncbi:molybdopterin-dependent oxidoreductase [Ketobacter sp.]|uniref:molybdopterin-dependent oxidoreductase n=1 Tax=Ketobacter sp. TaxID=2083498 RepID=UPI000F2BD8E2|nr:molybdopterin-dependent oxidoreductase [Ketobacter sp.]RLT96948.1 MAG: molybdopterin oxidoreductase family protein [Ketobacter sp.]